MATAKTSGLKANRSGLDFEAQLWAVADKMRGHGFPHDLHNRSRHGGTDFARVRKDLTNPPFNMSDWSRLGGMRQDVHWKFGMPPVNNANYAWIQHLIHHLSPMGVAGFVMANASISTQTSNEGEICKALIEASLIDCMVALPGQIFYNYTFN